MSSVNSRPNTRSNKNAEKPEKNLSDYFPPKNERHKPASTDGDTAMDLDFSELDPGPHKILPDGPQTDPPDGSRPKDP